MFLLNILIEEILKCHIKDCFKINGNQRIIMPKKVNMLNSKIMKKKESWFIYNLCKCRKYLSGRK